MFPNGTKQAFVNVSQVCRLGAGIARGDVRKLLNGRLFCGRILLRGRGFETSPQTAPTGHELSVDIAAACQIQMLLDFIGGRGVERAPIHVWFGRHLVSVLKRQDFIRRVGTFKSRLHNALPATWCDNCPEQFSREPLTRRPEAGCHSFHRSSVDSSGCSARTTRSPHTATLNRYDVVHLAPDVRVGLTAIPCRSPWPAGAPSARRVPASASTRA